LRQKNGRLWKVDLSWNGFGFEGCVAMAATLKVNTTLHMLDLSNNRIHPPALFQLWQGVCANKTLSNLAVIFFIIIIFIIIIFFFRSFVI
jgi:hypothetical protein